MCEFLLSVSLRGAARRQVIFKRLLRFARNDTKLTRRILLFLQLIHQDNRLGTFIKARVHALCGYFRRPLPKMIHAHEDPGPLDKLARFKASLRAGSSMFSCSPPPRRLDWPPSVKHTYLAEMMRYLYRH